MEYFIRAELVSRSLDIVAEAKQASVATEPIGRATPRNVYELAASIRDDSSGALSPYGADMEKVCKRRDCRMLFWIELLDQGFGPLAKQTATAPVHHPDLQQQISNVREAHRKEDTGDDERSWQTLADAVLKFCDGPVTTSCVVSFTQAKKNQAEAWVLSAEQETRDTAPVSQLVAHYLAAFAPRQHHGLYR